MMTEQSHATHGGFHSLARHWWRVISLALLAVSPVLQAQYTRPPIPFTPAAGEPGSEAIFYTDARLVAWASGFESYLPGPNVAASRQHPTRAIGPAGEDVFDVATLGRGGVITLTFLPALRNGSGDDFVVFENSFNDAFLELAFVEVSSDGVHFTRFPNYSLTAEPVGERGELDARFVHGLGGKFRLGYGVPFDLQTLQDAYALALTKPDWAGGSEFTQAYRDALVANFPMLDLEAITHVRLVDIVGNGSARDSEGFVIYDPFPTTGTAGFDLDGIGAIHLANLSGTPQTIAVASVPNQRLAKGSVTLEGSASSGLPVLFSVIEGPVSLSGNVLQFTGKGSVVIEARQSGNAIFAPATPQLLSFVIADDLQHLRLQPIRNGIAGQGPLAIPVSASSGLPVTIEIVNGPATASINASNELVYGSATGDVLLRVFQSGDATFAPTPELFIPFKLVSATSEAAPVSFAAHATANGLSGNPAADFDGDGVVDLAEFVSGSLATQASSVARPQVRLGRDGSGALALLYTFRYDPRANATISFLVGDTLARDEAVATPLEVLSYASAETQSAVVDITVALPVGAVPTFLWQRIEAP